MKASQLSDMAQDAIELARAIQNQPLTKESRKKWELSAILLYEQLATAANKIAATYGRDE